jgi:acrylyl-CoA reductase (NADPH)
MQVGGVIASIGLAAGIGLNTTVMPFILRGVSLLGVDSVNCPMSLRAEVWQRLATDLKPTGVIAQAREVAFADLPTAFDDFIKARVVGRILVNIHG